MTVANGRPKGTYSELGGAIRRLNVGESTSIETPERLIRNRISSMLCTLNRKSGMRFTSRTNRTTDTLTIYRTQ